MTEISQHQIKQKAEQVVHGNTPDAIVCESKSCAARAITLSFQRSWRSFPADSGTAADFYPSCQVIA
jgi:hypothetical protein